MTASQALFEKWSLIIPLGPMAFIWHFPSKGFDDPSPFGVKNVKIREKSDQGGISGVPVLGGRGYQSLY